MLAKRSGEIEKANGYHGPQLTNYAERPARGSFERRWNISGRGKKGSEEKSRGQPFKLLTLSLKALDK